MIFRAIETDFRLVNQRKWQKRLLKALEACLPGNFFLNFYEVIAILVLFEKLLRLILFIVRLEFGFFTVTKYEAFSLAHNKHNFTPICKSSIIWKNVFANYCFLA